MRILHVISGLPQAAGTSVFCVELCHALSQMSAGAIVGNSEKTESSHFQLQVISSVIAVCDPGNPDIYWPENQQSETSCLVSIESVLHGEPSFDLIHIHALWHPALHRVVTYAKRHRIPYIFSPHGMLTPWALGQKRVKKWTALAFYQYWDLRGAALIHVTAESELADVRRLGLKQPVVVAPLGVNGSTEDTPVRHNNPRIALFVSRVHPKKGLFNLVDAWASVRSSKVLKFESSKVGGEDRTSPWKFIIAGPDQGGHAAEVMARARVAGVADDFEIIGPVFGKEKDDLYTKADLFVLPSYSENFGVVVIEALAHGCPVITTKATPWQELPLERCGWWIDIGVEPLAQALKVAMTLTDGERYQMGFKGRTLVEKKYTWPAIATDMLRAYELILKVKRVV